MDRKSEISIRVDLDKENVPQKITWKASETPANMDNNASAMLVSFWEPDQETAFRLDLWTKEMTVEEMSQFVFQTLAGIADTYEKSTNYGDIAQEIRGFAHEFMQKFNLGEPVKSEKDIRK